VCQVGDGSMVRDYLYIDDAVRMILSIVTGRPQYDLYHVSSGIGASVTDVLAEIREVTGTKFPVNVLPSPATFVHRSVLDASRIEMEFPGGEPMSLHDGIATTWKGILHDASCPSDGRHPHL
jgi:UDP-glucose 4-epimerase